MPRPITGRRPDSLFDSRYRYDHIFPRGRSGETLRAYDTQRNDRPVVIKRPALQDAPPIRAGQEQSILREKRALELLAGHPNLTELHYAGTFRVGDQTHQYIVVDFAAGETLESLVLSGTPLPDLELLTILDLFLDLLQTAHDKGIINNDVDAKHLFWDRHRHALKIIDWGNAGFLDTDANPPGTRATDILQVGQMLYFIYSAGRRIELSRPDPAADLPEIVMPRVKEIINRTVTNDLSARYPNVQALRADLAELRRPLERTREQSLDRVRGKLATATTQSQLEALQEQLQDAILADPGFPATVELADELAQRLQGLALQADLDAVRIYIESGNMRRASSLLSELKEKLGTGDQSMLDYLLDLCEQVNEAGVFLPASLGPALDALFKNDAATAGRILATSPETRPEARSLQAKLAVRLSYFIPSVTLLRPHLIVLEDGFAAHNNYSEQAKVAALYRAMDARPAFGVQSLILHYGRLAEGLITLNAGDPTLATEVEQAGKAAEDIADLLEIVADNALGDTTRAGNALWRAAAIDPQSDAFSGINDLLNQFHSELAILGQFIPAADGNTLREYLVNAQAKLSKYATEISDAAFHKILLGIEQTIQSWNQALEYIALGGKRPAMEASRKAAESIQPLNTAIARWFEDYARKIEESPRPEMLSPNPTLGRALTEGWDAWDRGRGGEAQAAGERALSAAQTTGEQLAAQRLIALGEVLAAWLSNDGASSPERTQQAEARVTELFLPEEDAIRRRFNDQMPSMQIYLKAMSKGIVDPLRDTSAAAIRVLFFHYVLHGILGVQTEQFDEADFWREAASKSLSTAKTHPAFQALDTAITRRQLILDAVRVINATRSPAQLVELRNAVRAPLAAIQLDLADQSVRALEEALRKWPDGEFRVARQYLDQANERITATEAALEKDLTPFKSWLNDLANTAEVLAGLRRSVEQAAVAPEDEPNPAVGEALKKIVDLTRRDLGESYTAQLRQWRDTYSGLQDIYVDPALSRDEKLRLFESHFSAMFIERQPALPILKHWQSLVRALPDDEPLIEAPSLPLSADASATPNVRSQPARPVTVAPRRKSEYAPDSIIVDVTPTAKPPLATPANRPESDPSASATYVPFERKASPQTFPQRLLIIGAVAVIAIVGTTIFFLLRSRGSNNGLPITLTAEIPTDTLNGVGVNGTDLPPTVTLAATERASITATATLTATLTESTTPSPTPTASATATPAGLVPSPTAAPPSATAGSVGSSTLPPTFIVPTISPSTATPLSAGIIPGTTAPTKISVVELPTTVPEAQTGTYDLLEALSRLNADAVTWDQTWFARNGTNWELGNATARTGQGPLIRIGPDVLTTLYGTEAATFVKRIEARMELSSFNELLLAQGQIGVYFGLGLQNVRGGQRADARVRLVQPNVIAVGTVYNGGFRKKTELPITTVKVKLLAERNDDDTISLYLDGQLIDKSPAAFPAGVPMNIYLYTSTGGVVVTLTEMKVTLTR